MEMYQIIGTLSLALGASWCSGINLYATIGVLGLMHRYLDSFTLPAGLDVLGSDWVLWPAIFMYCVEFTADKVPAVDSVWDTVHTFIRIPAGAVIGAAALGDVPMGVQMGAAIVGGTLAFGSHTTKATTRLAAHSTGTSPVVSPVASLIEDGAVIGTMAFVATNPLIALGLLGVMLIVSYFILKTFWSLAKRVLAVLTRKRHLHTETDVTAQLIDEPATAAVRAT